MKTGPMKKEEFITHLGKLGACDEAISYVGRTRSSLRKIWPNPRTPLTKSWKVWLLQRLGYTYNINEFDCRPGTCSTCDGERKLLRFKTEDFRVIETALRRKRNKR